MIHDGQWLLSAAHCFPDRLSTEKNIRGDKLNYLRIKLGDYFNKGMKTYNSLDNVNDFLGLTSFCQGDGPRYNTNKKMLKENEDYK